MIRSFWHLGINLSTDRDDKLQDFIPTAHSRGGEHTVFGVDPVGASIRMTLSCLQNIL